MVYVGGVWKYGSQKSGWEEVCVFLLGISVTCVQSVLHMKLMTNLLLSFLGCLVSSTRNKIFKGFQIF